MYLMNVGIISIFSGEHAPELPNNLWIYKDPHTPLVVFIKMLFPIATLNTYSLNSWKTTLQTELGNTNNSIKTTLAQQTI